MKITINHDLKTPIYKQIATEIRALVLNGEIPTGCTLPSERTLAMQLDVHRNTIVKAYNELKAEGVITSSQGKGYIVEGNEWNSDAEEIKGKKVNWPSQIKDEYQDMEVTFDKLYQKYSDTKCISLGSGLAEPEGFNVKKLASDIGSIMEAVGNETYFYTPYQGDKEFRRQIASFLGTKGINASVSEIQVMKETNQALDFLVSLLLMPGDTVIMEEPASPDVFRAVQLAGGRTVTVPVDEDGMCVNALEGLVEKYKPRFVFVNSSFHDPTGYMLSEERKKKIIEISNRNRMIIIEEDAASELVYDVRKTLPIKAYDTLNNVIYIYSFQLTFVPGITSAFVVADKALIRSLSNLISVRLVGVDWLPQKLLAKYLKDGTYYKTLETLRSDYKSKRDLVCSRLDGMKDLDVEYDMPKGGVYVWCKLPKGIDSKKLTHDARKKGISLLPGHVFYPKKNGGRDYIRINYSYETRERLIRGMDILESLLEEELEHKK